MNRKTITIANLPFPSPLAFTVTVWLALDRLSAPGWIWGVALTLLSLIWLGFFLQLWRTSIKPDMDVDVIAGLEEHGRRLKGSG